MKVRGRKQVKLTVHLKDGTHLSGTYDFWAAFHRLDNARRQANFLRHDWQEVRA